MITLAFGETAVSHYSYFLVRHIGQTGYHILFLAGAQFATTPDWQPE